MSRIPRRTGNTGHNRQLPRHSLLALLCVLVVPPGYGQEPPPIPVEAVQSTTAILHQEITAVGTLRADEEIIIRPEIAGIIRALEFREGERVSSGTVIIRLDDALQQAELAQARADLNVAERQYRRQEELFKSGSGSASSRDDALGKFEAEQARVQLAQVKLAKTRITAPFEGMLGLRKVSPGDYVTPGQEMVHLVKLDPIKVEFAVPETQLRRIREGQQLQIHVDAYPGKTFTGEVYALDAIVDPGTRSLAMRARIANPDGLLYPGLFARVDLIISTHDNAIVIPEEAIVSRGGRQQVYVVVEGIAELVQVELGLRQNGQVEVIKGLKSGDTVIIAGQIKIRPGQKVKIINNLSATTAGEFVNATLAGTLHR